MYRDHDVYSLGFLRGAVTGRSEPTDRDWRWLADQTDGECQATDPQDAVTYADGMRAGATDEG